MIQHYLQSSCLLADRLYDASSAGGTHHACQPRSDIVDQLRKIDQLFGVDGSNPGSTDEILKEVGGLLLELEAAEKEQKEEKQ